MMIYIPPTGASISLQKCDQGSAIKEGGPTGNRVPAKTG